MNKKLLLFFLSCLYVITGCKKSNDGLTPASVPEYKTFTIKKGQHYSDQNAFMNIETSIMKFTVRFDSSAIYQSVSPENQYDINKLYGFSDNDANHHQYSARLGWRWSDNALRLFAYVYNAGVVSSREITSIPIGEEVNCSIVVNGSSYVFKVNEATEIIPRSATTPKAKGYQLYPYFGGNEPAPHDVVIRIKE